MLRKIKRLPNGMSPPINSRLLRTSACLPTQASCMRPCACPHMEARLCSDASLTGRQRPSASVHSTENAAASLNGCNHLLVCRMVLMRFHASLKWDGKWLFVLSLIRGCLCSRPRLQLHVSPSPFLDPIGSTFSYIGHVIPRSRGSGHRGGC